MTFCYHAVLRNGKSHSDAQKLYYREICSLKEGKKKKNNLENQNCKPIPEQYKFSMLASIKAFSTETVMSEASCNPLCPQPLLIPEMLNTGYRFFTS